MTLKKLLVMGCLGGALAFAACDKDNDDPVVTDDLNATDRTFLNQAAQANLSEIKAGQMAVTNTTNDSVRAYAQMMITDHQAAQTELDSLATNVSFDLPDSTDADHNAAIDNLMNFSGASFDSAYISLQVSAHDTVISQFENEVNSGAKSTVKAYANKYLPTLRTHAQMADSLAAHLPQ